VRSNVCFATRLPLPIDHLKGVDNIEHRTTSLLMTGAANGASRNRSRDGD